MRISRIYRLLRLITMLQGRRGYTVNELAGELEVSRRTIFRDLNMLEMARIPYYYDQQRGGYGINQHFFLPPINLTLSEALAILMLTGRLGSSSPLPLQSQCSRAAMKLQSALPRSVRDHVGSVVDRLSFSLGAVSRHEGLDTMFEDVASAVVRHSVCRIVYISFYEHKQLCLNIHPLRIVFLGRAWYVIAYSTKHREIRTFKLSRIRKLTVTERTFPPPKNVELEEYLGSAWGMIPEGKLYDIHLHFDAKVAGNVAEVHWHASQRVEWNDDGSVEFFVTVDGIGEITWWILGYGDRVEVISPKPLRKRIADVASTVVKKYRRSL